MKDTEELFLRHTNTPNLNSVIAEAAKQKHLAVKQAQTELKQYQRLQRDPDFQQFLKALSDRTDAAFEAMDKADTEVLLHKAVGEFIGVRRALKHADERVASLSTFLEEQDAPL